MFEGPFLGSGFKVFLTRVDMNSGLLLGVLGGDISSRVEAKGTAEAPAMVNEVLYIGLCGQVHGAGDDEPP